MSRKLLILFLCCLGIWPLSRFCHHQTQGFRLSKIQRNFCPTSHLPHEKLPFNLSGKRFTYLNRGLQSFSFVSEDGETVLKIFNNRYQRRLFWWGLVRSQEKIAYNEKKWARTFASYELAYEKLKKETGLLYLHLSKCSECPKVTIIDPLNIQHTIDLSNCAFALQKKAVSAYEFLDGCAREKDFEKAKKALTSLVSLIERKKDLGIADNDPLIRTNIGFLDDRAMQIDIGPFSYEDSQKKTSSQKEEIVKITLGLKHWIENTHPELLPYFYAAINPT